MKVCTRMYLQSLIIDGHVNFISPCMQLVTFLIQSSIILIRKWDMISAMSG